MAYTKVFFSILDSTVWQSSWQTKLTWITMLVMADRNGEVQASIPGLAVRAGVSIKECEDALAQFKSPDAYSRTKDDEGRRIEEIDGGWLLLNHEKYRLMSSDEDRKTKSAERSKRHYDKVKRNENLTPSSRQNSGSHASVTPDSTSRGKVADSKVADGDSKVADSKEEEEEDLRLIHPTKDISTAIADISKINGDVLNVPVGVKLSLRDEKHAGGPAPLNGEALGKRFKPPTREELNLAAAKIGLPDIEVDMFEGYYGSNGWMVGKNKMQSWRHSLAGWAARWRQREALKNAGHSSGHSGGNNSNPRNRYNHQPSTDPNYDPNAHLGPPPHPLD